MDSRLCFGGRVLMRLLRRGARRKSSPIGVPPVKSRKERGKRSRMVRVWCLSSNLTGLGNFKRREATTKWKERRKALNGSKAVYKDPNGKLCWKAMLKWHSNRKREHREWLQRDGRVNVGVPLVMSNPSHKWADSPCDLTRLKHRPFLIMCSRRTRGASEGIGDAMRKAIWVAREAHVGRCCTHEIDCEGIC
ncbi:hypothetical protein DEO72_LG3g2026 [Vigna unguiculata]|uniref:Uncharacterized protein n=1 Tax=Vigna unguiculata TaxID=3917 RepID=A0A4D6LG52_VIGUN|nr:hypothetical protein DEO72_LG3g2026 [Vigna unguiculata]